LPHPHERNPVEGSVGSAIAAAVEAVAARLAARGWDRADAAEFCNRGLGMNPLGIVAQH